MSEDNELTPEESRALAALAEGPEPPPGLEEAVVSRLAARGLFSPRRRKWAAWALAAAAGLALFFAGVTVGARRAAAPAASPAPAMTRYVLFLYDAPGEETLSAAEMAARVDEYRNWAIALRKQGSDITGEKLAQESLDLGPAGAAPGPEPLGGYFVFSAKDPAAALAVARSCPHVKHGGRAELRPIEET
jgi:YCII-related domain